MTFAYDPLGNILTATRGGATVMLTYDHGGRKTSMSDPDMGTWTYTYDALGNLTSQTDARGCTLTIGYDALNRPTSKSSSGAGCGTQVNTSYTYDVGTNGKGRRTSMSVSGADYTQWTYDPRGRVTKETKVISGSTFVTEWTYNLADLPETMKYPDGEIVTTAYNNRMLPISVTGADPYVSSMTYDSAARLLTRALGNGLTQTYTYYPWDQQGGRLQRLAAGSLQNLTYAYDPVGNILSIADAVSSETQTYTYDALDRLTSWSLNGRLQETYAYDETSGNLAVKGALTLEYLDPSHVHAVTNASSQSSVNSYQYDPNGNQTTRTIGSDTFTLLYDAENRLVEVKKNNVTISQFTYDGDGQRVKSVMDGETILFVGGYYERKGSEITKYYMAGATRVAMRKYTIPQNMTVEYLLGDHLGSTSITTDADGAKVSEMRYTPWGEVRYTWTNAPVNTSPAYELVKYQFTGQYSYDVEFGLKYYGARFYDSAVGRFVSADTMVPSGTQGYDRFAYTYNNPLRYNDPTGHIGCSPDERDEDPEGCAEDSTLETYTLVGIETMSPSLFGIEINYRPPWVVAVARFFGNDHVSEGRAKLYPEEVEELGIDPQTPEGAFLGMQARISSRMEACTGCSDTDLFIVAALGSDYNFGFDHIDQATKTIYAAEPGGTTTIDWVDFLAKESGNLRGNFGNLLSVFTSNVLELKSQGYYVPNVDFSYIQNTLLPTIP